MIMKIMNLLGLASIADVFWGRKPMIGAIASSPFNASFTLRIVSRIFIWRIEINMEMRMMEDWGRDGNWSFSIWRISLTHFTDSDLYLWISSYKKDICFFFTDSLSRASLAKWPCIVGHVSKLHDNASSSLCEGIVACKDNLYLLEGGCCRS